MAITDGYPGLEVPHSWYTPDNGTLLCKMNDSNDRPQIKLNQISGLHSRPDWEDNREDHIGRRGQTIYPSYPRSRTIVYEGVIRGKNLQGVRSAARNMRAAFNFDAEGTMRLGAEWFYRGRCTGLQIDEIQETGANHIWPWQRSFTLSIVQSDPRVYYSLPYIHAGTAHLAELHIDNTDSTVDSDPIITVHGSGEVVTLSNYSVPGKFGGHAELRFNDLPDGTLVVDFLHRTATVDGVDVTAKLASTTDWWDDGKPGLVPLMNVLVVTAMPGATWDIIFFKADA